MTYGVSGASQPSKNEKREVAREKAQQRRLLQKKKDRRNRVFVRGGIVLGVVAVVAVIAIAIVANLPKSSPGPLNMLSDGIRLGAGLVAEPTGALQPGKAPVPSTPKDDPEVVDIRVYLDYFCPLCGAFDKANSAQISTWVETGAATLEIHPISIMDRASQGTKYSTRAANAAACVANYAPNSFFTFNTLMFANEPEEGSTGLENPEILEIVNQATERNQAPIAACIEEMRFKQWVISSTTRALEGPLPGTEVSQIARTPTVLVNGVRYPGSLTDAAAFAKFVSGASGVVEETPTPSPSPSATPAP